MQTEESQKVKGENYWQKNLEVSKNSVFPWHISLLFAEPSIWVWVWSHVCLVPLCVHCDYGLQHYMSHYCTFWWVALLFIHRISHTGIKLKLLQCGVFPQGSSTWCWSTLWTNTTCTLPTCQLALNAVSTWEPWTKLWLHLLSAWYGSTFSLSSE